jgi:hypothetical protein
MKIFQVINNVAHADFSEFGKTKAEIPKNLFPKKLMDELVDAPNEVFIGWFYDKSNNQWIKPESPDGFEYDEESGTFYAVGASIEADRLFKNYPYLYKGVLDNIITKEQFEQITGSKFVENEEKEE